MAEEFICLAREPRSGAQCFRDKGHDGHHSARLGLGILAWGIKLPSLTREDNPMTSTPDEYTPTTSQVRDAFRAWWYRNDPPGQIRYGYTFHPDGAETGPFAAFDRWLAQQISQAEKRGAVKTLRSAARDDQWDSWYRDGADVRAWLNVDAHLVETGQIDRLADTEPPSIEREGQG